MKTYEPKDMQDFLPRTLNERLGKLRERMAQAWPAFSSVGGWDSMRLHLIDHPQGTVVRFFRQGKPITLDIIGAVKHGAAWHLSYPINGASKLTDSQMREYLTINQLNWVIIL